MVVHLTLEGGDELNVFCVGGHAFVCNGESGTVQLIPESDVNVPWFESNTDYRAATLDEANAYQEAHGKPPLEVEG